MSAPELRVLYRGPLGSCNYDCAYCPFAKHVSDREELQRDRESLAKFVAFVERTPDREFQILFTPWGEALTHRWYWDALRTLSHLPQVKKVAAQTNLSWRPELVREVELASFGLWCTFHPTETSVDRFLEKVSALSGVQRSVGIVGLKENVEYAEELASRLPDEVHLWVNAYKSEGADYYDAATVARFVALDLDFHVNNVRHDSLGKPCRAGSEAISVDGEGNARRCHFVDRVLGNVFRDSLEAILSPTNAPCPNATCGCHIGYMHLEELGLYERYGDSLMERVPRDRVISAARLTRGRL